MAFVDEIVLRAEAGRGGSGVVRWLHEKGKEFGGPSGGNGGKGGDIILRAIRDLNILMRYRGAPEFKAERGHDGSRNKMEGRGGKSRTIDLPIGARVVNETTGEVWELLEDGQEIVAFRGGRGGLGNAEYKSSTNQYPTQATNGSAGEQGTLRVELQIIADVGLVGLPNAGKSSILNAFTKTRSKVAAYAFTTLEPHLGVFNGYVMADIPGLIEGAAEGKGLGHAFLRHLKRTRILLHCVSVEHADVVAAYQGIRSELSRYDEMLSTKPEIVFLTKTDEVSPEVVREKLDALQTVAPVVVPVSILDEEQLDAAEYAVVSFLQNSASVPMM